MTLEYAEIFAHRGDAYHAAMLLCPDARSAEFLQLFARSAPEHGQRVLDIPAGGGYLRRYLVNDVELVSLELTAGFGNGVPVFNPKLPWHGGTFDHIVCLAALHHIEDKKGFIDGLRKALHTNGTLHLADASADSGITRFLDGFVGRYNIPGHEGHYLPRDPEWFAALGQVTSLDELPCPWHFSSEQQMLEFCGNLFGLIDCPPTELREALCEHVGFHHEANGVSLDWRLVYADIQAN